MVSCLHLYTSDINLGPLSVHVNGNATPPNLHLKIYDAAISEVISSSECKITPDHLAWGNKGILKFDWSWHTAALSHWDKLRQNVFRLRLVCPSLFLAYGEVAGLDTCF